MTARLLLLVAVGLGLPALSAAQTTPAPAEDSRAAAIAADQAEKATRLAPYTPHRAEVLLLKVRRALIELPAGFYPYFGSVYSGGGFTLGGGYRLFTGDRTHWSVAGLASAKAYTLLEASTLSPGHLDGRLDLHATALWRDATQVRYHGLGIDSAGDIDTGFRMQEKTVGGDITLRPHRYVVVTAGAAYEDYTIQDPTGDFISVEDTFTPAAAPGLNVDPAYVHTSTALAFDSRPAAGYARRGGLYSLSGHSYADRDNTYSFNRLDAEAIQHVPVLRENWVLSVRGRLQTTLDDDDEVPYFLMPSLGSGSTLRGYNAWRFRDRHAMLVSGEFRWIPNRMAVDMALFYDAGMVAPRLDAIVLRSFKSNVGVGIRFHTLALTPLRIELARGSEGLQLVFGASAAF